MKPGDPPPRPTSRERAAIETQAAQWIARREAGLSAAENAELEAWRTADAQHDAALQRFEAMAAALGRARHTGAMNGIRTELAARARQRRTRRATLTGVAAAVAIAVAGLSVARRLGPLPPPATALRSGAVVRHLPDGSSVELNVGARIALHFDARFRRVELLQGEALFEVAKDAQHPFIVRAGDVDVRAVGTAFSVRLAPRQVEVLVTEGKVGVNEASGGRTLLPGETDTKALPLVAGKQAVVGSVHPTLAVVTDVSPGEMARRLAWRSPRIDFDGTELALAVQQINERNPAHPIVVDAAAAQLRISGSFPANEPETFARLAAVTFGLRAEKRDGKIMLSQPTAESDAAGAR